MTSFRKTIDAVFHPIARLVKAFLISCVSPHRCFRKGLIFSIGIFFAILAISPANASKDPYYTLIYDFEVAIICGLADRTLYDNYLVHRNRIETRDHRGESELTSVRIKAMAAADREYDNRGLGGHRNWCATDGQDGVERIGAEPN